MAEEKNDAFEEIVNQNKNRIYYQIHKLGILDPYQEFYAEEVYALWMAYKKYQPNKGPMATYFNFTIRNHLLDLLRKETRTLEKREKTKQEELVRIHTGNLMNRFPLPNDHGILLEDEAFIR